MSRLNFLPGLKKLVWLAAMCPLFSFGTSIEGKITDEKMEPLPFATIFLKGTTIGTTSNADGFYSLAAPRGEYEIVFQYVGYKKYIRKISLSDETIILNVVLTAESVELKEVTVDANAEDPAYAIIRKAQDKRRFYLNRVNAYSCNVYIKNLIKLDNFPQKILGFKTEKQGIDSSLLGILYLSESESQYNFEKPDKVKEIVFSSKVSGNNSGFTWNSATAFSSDFYQNIIPLGNISPRGMVSPIAEGAFTFYRYKLLGTFYEDGLLINKIQVIAKRPTDPAFNGTIYIVEEQWCIHSLDLFVTKEAHLDFIDSLRFTETYGRINDSLWMPFNQVLQFKVGALGFDGSGKFLAVFSGYDLSPDFPDEFFDAERIKVNDDANKKDSLYWEQHRPVPLTLSEEIDYDEKDSIYKVHNSKEYLDSTDRKSNKFKIQSLLLGYSYRNSFHKFYYTWRNPIEGITYNTVEGFNMTLRNTFRKQIGETRNWKINADFRYGFSNKKAGARALLWYNDDPIHRQQWHVAGGIFPTQINKDEPISETVNSLYSLIAHQNFMKLYENRVATFQHNREWFNGFDLAVAIAYSDRVPLENTTDYSFDWIGDHAFTSNNSFDNLHSDTLIRTQALTIDFSADITIGQQYVTRPNGRFAIGSKFPTFNIYYKKGIKALSSDIKYDLVELSLRHTLNLGLAGKSIAKFSAGTYLNNDSTTLIEFKHFQGNQTILGAHYADGFQLLPYYTYSTNEEWLEGHYEHHFGGFLMNKIPLIKKLNLQEVGGAHLLWTKDIRYIELSAGLEHLFKVFRVDFVVSFGNNGETNTGFLIGLNFGSGAISIE